MEVEELEQVYKRSRMEVSQMEEALKKVIAENQVDSTFKLASLLGLTILYEELNDEINGYYYKDESENKTFIVINSQIPEELTSFVCAYLISHHTQSKGTLICFSDESRNVTNYYLMALEILRETTCITSDQNKM